MSQCKPQKRKKSLKALGSNWSQWDELSKREIFRLVLRRQTPATTESENLGYCNLQPCNLCLGIIVLKCLNGFSLPVVYSMGEGDHSSSGTTHSTG